MVQVVPEPLERLIADLTTLPGIGRKTATRLALYLLRRPPAQARRLAEALGNLHDSIRLCSTCFTFSETDPCGICADERRDRGLVCVVEEPADLMAVEKSRGYQGVYHVLHGVLAPMEGIGPDELKIRELVYRVAHDQVAEVLIATNSTVPGEATAAYLVEVLKKYPVRVSRLACGIPMGMDIKYADMHTLGQAIAGRRVLPRDPG